MAIPSLYETLKSLTEYQLPPDGIPRQLGDRLAITTDPLEVQNKSRDEIIILERLADGGIKVTYEGDAALMRKRLSEAGVRSSFARTLDAPTKIIYIWNSQLDENATGPASVGAVVASENFGYSKKR